MPSRIEGRVGQSRKYHNIQRLSTRLLEQFLLKLSNTIQAFNLKDNLPVAFKARIAATKYCGL